ncbi:hypothetical protein AOXY_G16269 [Acipenser oxyrinchus oxyrinchus]|uniref:Uncharacterized protein n=1 Tax=Acipenser oxyrinchus oxyrinchus TaxID=40147 RepID=A0AAD8D8P8_ACIOX|nr:hypothetical protein AOXY_G16269 [Acipenser oxyrinchus oxyrinchus]
MVEIQYCSSRTQSQNDFPKDSMFPRLTQETLNVLLENDGCDERLRGQCVMDKTQTRLPEDQVLKRRAGELQPTCQAVRQRQGQYMCVELNS